MVRLRALWERLRGNLFFVPFVLLLASIGLAQAMLAADVAISNRDVELPGILGSTVDSARALLGTIAGATITVAAIAFSISLLMIQLVSSQFSPRVLHGFFRDRFTKRVLGLVVGTFTYCLLVLRAVRRPIEEGGAAVIPNVSVFVGLLLGVVSVLAIVAFITHSAHSMEAGEIIRRITAETREQIRRLWPRREEGEEAPEAGTDPPEPPSEPPGAVVAAPADGWVQQVDTGRLLRVLPEGGRMRLDVRVGDFVPEGTPLCAVWPEPEDPDALAAEVRDAVHLGRGRTMQQDLGFGIRQLVDMALRALSPGVNDPTTAEEVLVHLGTILRDLLLRDPPPRHLADDRGRSLFRPRELAHDGLVELAFGQIRRAGSSQVAVALRMLDVLGMLVRQVEEAGLPERAGALRGEAEQVIRQCAEAWPLEEDVARVRARARDLGLVPDGRVPEAEGEARAGGAAPAEAHEAPAAERITRS